MTALPQQGGAPRSCSYGVVLLVAIFSAACGATLQKLPTGPGAPAADAPALFAETARACRAVRSLSAEMSVSGSAIGQRLRGRVLVGLSEPGAALLDAAAPFGASIFLYAARDGQATLLLPRDRRVLRDGEPAAVLAAVTGVPLGPDDLRRALTGCVGAGADGRATVDPTAPRAFGTDWRSVTVGEAEVYLHRLDGGRWRTVAILHGGGPAAGWRADYGGFADDLPRSVHLRSADEGRRFDLRLQLSQVEINPPLGAEVFLVKVPDEAVPLTLDELRRNGPMADVSR